MSYDLMVFEPSIAPRDPSGLIAWYEATTEWKEEHSYIDPAVCSPALRDWFLEMIKTFPAMNGPDASNSSDDATVTDYCVGRTAIYAGFAGSIGERAYAESFRLAQQFGLGFFEASGTGGFWRPDDAGRYAETNTDGVPRTPRLERLQAAFPTMRIVSSPASEHLSSMLAGSEDKK